jgi:hypothetical protein
MTSIASTRPPFTQGAYFTNPTTAVTDHHPDTGRGVTTGTAGSALWADQGLAAGTFEVIIESVHVDAVTTLVVITELHADASHIEFLGHATLSTPYKGIRVPMRDGFSFTTTGGGAVITFRIQVYQEA